MVRTYGANTLQLIRLGSGSRGIENATVRFADGVTSSTPGVAFTLPAGQRQTALTVTRQAPAPFLASFVISDTCGDWPSFVGIGSGGN